MPSPFAVRVLLLLTVAVVVLDSPALSEISTGHVLIGPNILVSRDGDIAQVEISAAVNPKNPKEIVASVITATRPLGGWACRTYAKMDGGNTWVDSIFHEQVEFGGGDPQVTFTTDGAALFAALSLGKDEQGQDHNGLYVYRSEDGGRTWGRPVVAAIGADHPQMIVDHTGGKYNGRVHIVCQNLAGQHVCSRDPRTRRTDAGLTRKGYSSTESATRPCFL